MDIENILNIGIEDIMKLNNIAIILNEAYYYALNSEKSAELLSEEQKLNTFINYNYNDYNDYKNKKFFEYVIQNINFIDENIDITDKKILNINSEYFFKAVQYTHMSHIINMVASFFLSKWHNEYYYNNISDYNYSSELNSIVIHNIFQNNFKNIKNILKNNKNNIQNNINENNSIVCIFNYSCVGEYSIKINISENCYIIQLDTTYGYIDKIFLLFTNNDDINSYNDIFNDFSNDFSNNNNINMYKICNGCYFIVAINNNIIDITTNNKYNELYLHLFDLVNKSSNIKNNLEYFYNKNSNIKVALH